MSFTAALRRVPFVFDATDTTGPATTSAKTNMKSLGDESARVNQRMAGQWEGVRSSYLKVAAGVTAAILAVRKGWDLANTAAIFDEQKGILESLSAQYNITATDMIRGVQEMSRGLIAQADAAQVSARAMVLGFAPDQILEMVKVAEVFTDAIGGEIPDAMEAMSQAIATGQTRALKQFGVIVDLNEVYKEFAKSVGKSADDLTIADKRNALYQETMRQTGELLKKTGPAIDSTKDKFDRIVASMKDFGMFLGQILIRVASFIETIISGIAGTVARAVATVFKGLSMVQDFLGKFGVTFETDFLAKWAKWDAVAEDSFKNTAEAWAATWASMEQTQTTTLAQMIANAESHGEEVKKKIAAIPPPAVDIDIFSDPDFLAAEEAYWAASRERLDAWAETREKIQQREKEFQAELRQGAIDNAVSISDSLQVVFNQQDALRKKGFNIFKAVSVAETIISAHQAFANALRTLPPPFSYVAAAAAFASAMARVAAIRGTNPGAGAASAPAIPVAQTPSAPQQNTQGGPVVTVIIEGHVLSMDSLARELIPAITKATKDRVE